MMRFLSSSVLLLILLSMWSQPGYAQYPLTGLSGFHAVQTNQCIRASDDRIDVIFSASYDSVAGHNVTQYTSSTNGGLSWNTFGNIWVPYRFSGHPTLDLGKGVIEDGVIIANHSVPSSLLQSTASVDFPPGMAAFAELSPPTISGSDEPIDPFVGAAADGSIIILASRLTAGTCYITRTVDYISWFTWVPFPGGVSALGLMADSVGRVVALARVADGGILLMESSNNVSSWGLPHEIVPPVVVAGADSFAASSNCDLAFSGSNVFVSFSLLQYVHGTLSQKGAIGFWSEGTGTRVVVRHNDVYGIADSVVRCDGINYSLGQPAMALLRSVVYIVFFSAMEAPIPGNETLGDLYYSDSYNGGNTWYGPWRFTDSPSIDETYPSLAKSGNTYRIHAVWQTRSNTCPGTRAFQRYDQIGPVEGVDDRGNGVAKEYALFQNYPNPFNPVTMIQFSLPSQGISNAEGRVGVGSYVALKVYDVLGREVVTLVNEVKPPGTYAVQFDASGLATGVYFYRLSATNFVQTRKLLVLR